LIYIKTKREAHFLLRISKSPRDEIFLCPSFGTTGLVEFRVLQRKIRTQRLAGIFSARLWKSISSG
jgi:hypothetical protein